MYGKRFLMKALVGLLVIALLIGVSSSMQRNAWMQGYMMGQLSAGGDGKAVAPYMAYSLQGYGGSGLGGGLAILLGVGLLALLFLGFGRIFLGGRWATPGGSQAADEQAWQRLAQAHAERVARRWGHGPPGCWDEAGKPVAESSVPEAGGTVATEGSG
jgi:hypothetical protein